MKISYTDMHEFQCWRPYWRVIRLSKVSILVVDDTAFWRELVASTVENESSLEIICEVVDGLQAVRMAAHFQPTIALLDIGLPRMSGIDAAKRIRTLAPQTKILFLSEQRDLEVIEAALNVACGYVLKSDAAKDLIPAIHSVAAGKPFVSSQLGGLSLEAKGC
jgi:DNA-binding NarL/FixJ family response regulator